MAFSALPKLVFLLGLCFICFHSFTGVEAQVDQTSLMFMNEALEWPTTISAFGEFEDEGEEEDMDFDGGGAMARRSLFWRRAHYYISYGALSANRIPCPPRSGRSYYTHNCYRARGPANPYTRGCSRITRCRR